MLLLNSGQVELIFNCGRILLLLGSSLDVQLLDSGQVGLK